MNKQLLMGIGAGIVVLLVLGGFVGYRIWTGTPEYALLQIQEAVETHDRGMFHEFVDVESVVSRGVDVYMEQQQAETKEDDGLGGLASGLAAGLMQMMKPKLTEMATSAIDKYIESSAETDDSSGDDGGSFNLGLLEPGSIENTRSEGKIKLAELTFQHKKYDCDLTAVLKFRETDAGHLQIVELVNLAEVLETVNTAEKEWKQDQNRPIREQLDKTVTLVGHSITKKSDRWGFEKKATLNIEVDNLTDKTITEWEGELELYEKDGTRLLALSANAAPDEFTAGGRFSGSIEYEIGMFDSNLQTLWNAEFEQLTAKLKLNTVKFADGESVVLPYPDIE